MNETLRNPTVKRALACVFLGYVAAVVTDGYEGDGTHPLKGFLRPFTTDNSLTWIVVAVVVFGLLSLGLNKGYKHAASALRGVTSLGGRAGSAQVRYPGYLVLLLLAILLPRAMPAYLQVTMFTGVAIYALLALGLNVVVGYAGLLDLGFIAFYAIGAYVSSYLTRHGTPGAKLGGAVAPFHLNGFITLPIAAIIAAIAGLILGGPTLRLRGDYLAIVTLGFGEIVQILATNNVGGITNGAQGIFGTPGLTFGSYKFATNGANPLKNYYLVLGIIVLVMVAFSRLEKSRTGRAWAAIREDEVAAAATGVRTLKYKLLAFAIGASTSGFAGVIFGSYQFYNQQSFGYQQSILVLTIVIFGGMGNIFGAVAGAFILQFLTAYLQHNTTFGIPVQDSYLYFGAIVMLMMVFRTQGLIPSRRRSREIKLAESGEGSADALGPAEGSVA